MRSYIYLFVVLVLGAVFAGMLFQAPDPGADSRNAFLSVCERSDVVRKVSASIDKAAMACSCIAGWHLKRTAAGAEAFYPNQLYILTGSEAAAGLSPASVATDAKARAACLK